MDSGKVNDFNSKEVFSKRPLFSFLNMQIAIVADSHGSLDRLEEVLKNLQKAKIKYLIHAGDGINYGIEDIFIRYPEIHIFYALGNCDVNSELITELKKIPHVKIESILELVIEQIKIGVSHIQGIAEANLKAKKIDVFIHGHTHRAKIDKQKDRLILNPGALSEDGKYYVLSLPELKIEIKRFDENLTF